MINVSNCVICGGDIRRLKRALVAPFLAARIWARPPFCVDLAQCQGCGFMFYNPRLDATEEGRIYSGYRTEEYQRMRQASEPWYTLRLNADLASPRSYEIRRQALRTILRQHIGKREIRRVLDYGGDRGDLVRGLIDGAAAFVYDISGIPAVDGVSPTTDPVGCKADLIISSNVLEHVGFPNRLVREMLKAVPAGGVVFLEVPSESPFGLARIARRVAQVGIMGLTRPVLARSVARPASLYMMHEHVNYFTERSLTTLLRCCGCEVIAAGTYFQDWMPVKANMAWCMGTTT